MDKFQTRINRDPCIKSGANTNRSTNININSGIDDAAPNQASGAAARRAHNDSGHHLARKTFAQSTQKYAPRGNAPRTNVVGAIALAGSAIAMSLFALGASAEITEDCILEGTVDMRMAEQLGQPVYVRFRNAERGSEARCSLNRRSNSRRVQFISSPDEHDLDVANHGDRVRYRYMERDGNPGTWQLIEVSKR